MTLTLSIVTIRVVVALAFSAAAVTCHLTRDNRTAALWWIAAGAWLPR